MSFLISDDQGNFFYLFSGFLGNKAVIGSSLQVGGKLFKTVTVVDPDSEVRELSGRQDPDPDHHPDSDGSQY
jgi:hypothetical protein